MVKLRFWIWILSLVLAGPAGWCADADEAADEGNWITTVRALRELSEEEAADQLQVRITGVITYLEPFRGIAFVQDATGGTYFSTGQTRDERLRNEPLPYKLGDRVEITGVSGAGSFAPILQPNHHLRPSPVKVLKTEPWSPTPIVLPVGRVMDPSKDGWWVETTGVVRQLATFERRLVMQLTNGFEEFAVVIPGDWTKASLPNEYVGSSVKVSGVFGARADGQRQLISVQIFTPSPAQIIRLDQGIEQAFAEPPVALGQLRQFRASPTDRLRVTGTVTASFPGREFYLRNGDASIAVTSDDRQLPAPGDTVDVVAYPLFTDGRVALHTPVVRVRGAGEVPEPYPVPPYDLMDSRWRGELVRTQARLVNRFVAGRDCLLLLTDADRTFSVRLTLGEGEAPPDHPLESWLELTGIAFLETEALSQPLAPWARPTVAEVRSFSLLLRGPEDVRLLRAPPFWTPERVGVVLSGGGVALALVVAWSALLQHRLRQRTAELESKIEREQVAAERARIARELHDTVEQELAGIGLQLDLAHARVSHSPERAKPALELALRMLRRTQQETRASIQDLRSELFERADLPAALRASVENLREEQGALIEVELEELPRRLPAVTEHNLLRLAQEAMTNAVRHAQAGKITVRLRRESDVLVLEVADDGVGFNAAVSRSGHFGLQGMGERARKIGATLVVDSQPGGGTRIHVRLPYTVSP